MIGYMLDSMFLDAFGLGEIWPDESCWYMFQKATGTSIANAHFKESGVSSSQQESYSSMDLCHHPSLKYQ